MLTQQLGGGNLGALSQTLGSDEKKTQGALAAALPILMAAMARNSSTPDGASSLHHALSRDHDGSVLDDLQGFLRSPDTGTGDGILRHVLGERRSQVEEGISKSSGLDAASVAKLMATVAPLVMGALGRQQRQQDLDVGALTGVLAEENRTAAETAPALSGLARILDSDQDGSVADDLAKLGKGLLGGLFKD
jgi:hypothetical protein